MIKSFENNPALDRLTSRETIRDADEVQALIAKARQAAGIEEEPITAGGNNTPLSLLVSSHEFDDAQASRLRTAAQSIAKDEILYNLQRQA